MASVSWDGKHSKLKTVGQVRQMLQHFDPRRESRERIKTIKEKNGEITHIRPENSRYNIDINVDTKTGAVYSEILGDKSPGVPVFSSYISTKDRHKKELDRLDSLPGQNQRKNRVINQLIEIPAPGWLQFDPDGTEEEKQKQAEALQQFYSELLKRWIKDGVIAPRWVAAAVVHLDEVHTYRDTEEGTKRDSRSHLHLMIFPTDEKEIFSSKKILTRTRIIQSNYVTNNFCRENYGKNYGTGSKRKSKKSVQTLKQESEEREAEALLAEVAVVQAILDDLKEQEQRQREELQRQRIRVTELRKEGDTREELRQILEDLKQYRDERREESEAYSERLLAYIEAKARPATVPYILQILENFEKDEETREKYEGRTARRVAYLSEQLQKKEQKATQKATETPQKPAEAPRKAPERVRVEQKQETPRSPQKATEKPTEPRRGVLEEYEKQAGRILYPLEKEAARADARAIYQERRAGRDGSYYMEMLQRFPGLDIEGLVKEVEERDRAEISIRKDGGGSYNLNY